MDQLPVEVIGHILSRFEAPRHMVNASATCRKWQEAWRNHVRTLSFESDNLPQVTVNEIETLITKTILQTNGLRSLSISLNDFSVLSAAAVISWHSFTRETLRALYFNARTTTHVNILEECGRHKLEVLCVSNNYIMVSGPCYPQFPCLKYLSLLYISISTLDLSSILGACPEIEQLALTDLNITDASVGIKLRSSSLKDIFAHSIGTDKLILEADNLEKLFLQNCTLVHFKLVSRKGSLKHLQLDDVGIDHLDIGEVTKNLEVVYIRNFIISWSLLHIIKSSLKLKSLQLWEVDFGSEGNVLNFESSPLRFPQLSHLWLNYDFVEYGFLRYNLFHGYPNDWICLDNVVLLYLGGTVISRVPKLVEKFLEKCPNLKKLVIDRIVSEIETEEDCNSHASFMSFLIQLTRRYAQVQVSFEFS